MPSSNSLAARLTIRSLLAVASPEPGHLVKKGDLRKNKYELPTSLEHVIGIFSKRKLFNLLLLSRLNDLRHVDAL